MKAPRLLATLLTLAAITMAAGCTSLTKLAGTTTSAVAGCGRPQP
jgi:hypothetical protein